MGVLSNEFDKRNDYEPYQRGDKIKIYVAGGAFGEGDQESKKARKTQKSHGDHRAIQRIL